MWTDPEALNRLAFWLGIVGSIALLVALGLSRLAKRIEDQRASASAQKIEQLDAANAKLTLDLDARSGQVKALEAETADLKRKALPRTVTPDQRGIMVAELKKAGPHAVAVACHMFDLEACEYAKQIHDVFVRAGWTVSELIQNSTLSNDAILLTSNINPSTLAAFAPVKTALTAAGIKTEVAPLTGSFISPVYERTLHVIVGPKPLG